MNLAFVNMEQPVVAATYSETGHFVCTAYGPVRVEAGFLLSPGEVLPQLGTTVEVQGRTVRVESVRVANQQHGRPIVTVTGSDTGPWNSGIYADPDPIPPFDLLGSGSIEPGPEVPFGLFSTGPSTPAQPEPKPLSRPFGEAPRKVLL